MGEHTSGSAWAELEHVRDAQRALEKVRHRLWQPSVPALNACTADLNNVVQFLEQLQNSLSKARPAGAAPTVLAPEIQKLRAELKVINTLVAAAGRFYAGWSRLINAADQESPNYSSSGEAPPPIPIDSARVVMHG